MVVTALLCTVLSLRPARPLALAALRPMSRAAERRLCALSRLEGAATVLRPDASALQRAVHAGAGVRGANAAARCALITCMAAADGGGSWSAHETAAGVPYYFNAADGTSSWELPSGVTLAAPPPPPPPAASYGAESPLPGREHEYAEP